jgi:hypothetical protein
LQAGAGANQLLQTGDGEGDTLIGGSGADDTLTAGNGNNDYLQAGSGVNQLLEVGSGTHDTLVSANKVGDSDTLSAGGDFATFEIGTNGNVTVIVGGAYDTIDFGNAAVRASITEDDPTDTVSVHFSDTGQTVTISPDDSKDITLHFNDGGIHILS